MQRFELTAHLLQYYRQCQIQLTASGPRAIELIPESQEFINNGKSFLQVRRPGTAQAAAVYVDFGSRARNRSGDCDDIALPTLVRELRWEDCHEKRDRIYRVGDAIPLYGHHLDQRARYGSLGESHCGRGPGVRRVSVFRHVEEVTLYLNQKSYRAGKLIFAAPEILRCLHFSSQSPAIRPPA